MATHPSILAWRTPKTVYPWGHKESDTTEQLSLSLLGAGTLFFCPQHKLNDSRKAWHIVGAQEICVK